MGREFLLYDARSGGLNEQEIRMYQIVFYVPETHLEVVKEALFNAGAGKVGDYDCCAWQTPGQGQFRPLEGCDPFIGQVNKVETVVEYKVELVCEEVVVKTAVAAMIAAHPYEEPAYSVWLLQQVLE